MSENILITGGLGFVGSQVTESLSNLGKNLTLVIRNQDIVKLSPLQRKCTIVLTDDLFSECESWWSSKCKEIDIIIHLAWFTKHGLYLDSKKNLDCLIGSINMAKGALRGGVRRFVGIGTCFEYDLSHNVLSIDTPIKPTSIYADTKAALFFTLSNLLVKNGLSFAWCRLFYLYGDGENQERFVSYLRNKIKNGEIVDLSEGSQIRDFLDVRKAGKMICDVALGQKTGPINICSGQPKTIKQFAEEIADEYGRRDLLSFGARKKNPVDPPCVIGVR